MTARELRQKYLNFFKQNGHIQIEAAKLVLEGDLTTLFTSAGMQPLIPYLLGKPHQAGKRLVNSQPCFRADDIGEVGDNRHTTFFEMLGNWSLGDYFKKEQLPWIWEFLTEELKLPKEKLHVSVFEGYEGVPKDVDSYKIWKELDVPDSRIHFYGVNKNWWSRSGPPENMPVGEVGGPDSEIFYDFGIEHDKRYGEECHPNCDCGRFLEIGNSVFIQYKKKEDGSLEELKQKNVDFGGGLERLVAASNDNPDIFEIDLNKEIISEIENNCDKKYTDWENQAAMRVIADHLKAATFLIVEGVRPSNKMQGYILRRLLRRSAIKMNQLRSDSSLNVFTKISDTVLRLYNGNFGIDRKSQRDEVGKVINEEMEHFSKTLKNGLAEYKKMGSQISGNEAFLLLQSFGFPIELTEELARQDGKTVDNVGFDVEFKRHQEASRTS